MNNQKGLASIVIVLILVAIIGGGILAWQYWWASQQEEIKTPEEMKEKVELLPKEEKKEIKTLEDITITVSECGNIKECYYKRAEIKDVERILSECEKSPWEPGKGTCYKTIALILQDSSICDKIVDFDDKIRCYGMFGKEATK